MLDYSNLDKRFWVALVDVEDEIIGKREGEK